MASRECLAVFRVFYSTSRRWHWHRQLNPGPGKQRRIDCCLATSGEIVQVLTPEHNSSPSNPTRRPASSMSRVQPLTTAGHGLATHFVWLSRIALALLLVVRPRIRPRPCTSFIPKPGRKSPAAWQFIESAQDRALCDATISKQSSRGRSARFPDGTQDGGEANTDNFS